MQNNLYAINVVASFVNLDASPVNQNPLFLNRRFGSFGISIKHK